MIINPNFALKEKNIFSLRKEEYSKLVENVREVLRPIEEIGFRLEEFGIKKMKRQLSELSETIKDNLCIKFRKDEHLIDLSFYIPSLLDEQYFLINGMRKVPLFQLYDTPIIKRKDLKLKTNIMTISIVKEKELPVEDDINIMVSFSKKEVPLALLFFATYGPEAMERRFNLRNVDKRFASKFLLDLKLYYDESQNWTKDNFIEELGKIFPSSRFGDSHLQRGKGILYLLDLIIKSDVSTRKLFKNPYDRGSIIEELLYALEDTSYTSDVDMLNRRLRLSEYLVLANLSKTVFDFCVSNKDAKKPKYNINSQRLISDINISDIVQFDFSINPIDELTKLSRTTLLGPGGFNRDNVPEYLRDIDDSMFGRLCVVDTPDRENCGVLQCALPNIELDENLKFTEHRLENEPISMAVSMVPFLENDDQTRLQMAASQMRQAIMLRRFDKPLVQSGCEGLYTPNSQFIKIAKDNGQVVFIYDKEEEAKKPKDQRLKCKNRDFMIVRYDNGEIELINIAHRNIFVGNINFFNPSRFAVGDKFKKGDILIESNFCRDGEITIGRNLLTAVMPYLGYNYEDGIVISDRLVNEKILTSVHYEDLSFTLEPSKVLLNLDPSGEYKPLPDKEDTLKQNDVYAKIREIFNEKDFDCIFCNNVELRTKKDIMIIDYNIYANDWHKGISEFNNWIDRKITQQRDEEIALMKEIRKYFDNNDEFKKILREQGLNKFGGTGKYKMKGERINGVRFEIAASFQRQIKLGDKVGNRHGNKGVVSKIVPEDTMPRLKDGTPVDIVINPLGIISRMNLGQLFELHSSVTIQNLKKEAIKMLYDGKPQDEIKQYIINYIKIMDNTKTNWYSTQFINELPEVIDADFIDRLSIIAPPFESTNFEKLIQAKEYTNSEFEQEIFDPFFRTVLENKVSVGWMYFFRMVHIAEEKLSMRGVGPYTKRTLQPVKGKKHSGGQRLGEMEVACLIAHDAPENLNECLTIKSDAVDMKNKWLKEELGNETKDEEIDTEIESVRLLKSYFRAIGIEI